MSEAPVADSEKLVTLIQRELVTAVHLLLNSATSQNPSLNREKKLKKNKMTKIKNFKNINYIKKLFYKY